jgi:hypothetical protein
LQFKPVLLEPGKPIQIPYNIAGTFPVGSARANLSITSQEIDSPITIPVEVRTSRTKTVLAIALIAGLALGFLMRTMLTQLIQFGEAKEKGLELLRTLQSQHESVPDLVFRNELENRLQLLKGAIEKARVDRMKTLTDITTTINQNLADALSDLQRRSNQVTEDIRNVSILVKTQWRLSQSIRDQLGLAQKAINIAGELNKNQNPTAARTQLDSTIDELTRLLADYARKWETTADLLVAGAGDIKRLLQPPARQSFSDMISRIADLQAHQPSLSGEIIPDTKTLLTYLDNMTTQLSQLFANIAAGVMDTFDSMDSAMRSARPPDPPAWEAGKIATIEFVDWLRSKSGDLDAAPQLQTRVDALANAWKAAFTGQNPSPEASRLMSEGEYVAAVDKLAQDLKLNEPTLQGDMPAPAGTPIPPNRTAIMAMVPSQSQEPPTPFAVDSSQMVWQKPSSVDLIEGRTFKELLFARRLQWSLSALVLALLGFFLFQDKFVGTSGDLMTAFVWGFTTDIGLDAIIAASGKNQGKA